MFRLFGKPSPLIQSLYRSAYAGFLVEVESQTPTNWTYTCAESSFMDVLLGN